MHLREYDIAGYLDGSIESSRKKSLDEHLADCAQCTAAVSSAFKVARNARWSGTSPALDPNVFEKAARLTQREHNYSMRLGVRIAAIITVLIGLSYWGITTWTSSPSAFRSDGETLNVELIAPQDGITVSSMPQFRWKAMEGVFQYRLNIYSEEGSTLFEERTKVDELAPSSSLVFQSGNLYLWSVEAQFPDGSTVNSALYTFRYVAR